MQKTYVLDTNVLIQSPRALLSFEDNHIVLPLAVLEELDALKTGRRQCPRLHPLSGGPAPERQPHRRGGAGWRRFAAARGQLCGRGAAGGLSG